MRQVLNRATILEVENNIFILSSNIISKDKKTIFVSEEFLNEDIERIDFWKEDQYSLTLIKIEGCYVSKHIPSVNIVFNFEIETNNFLSNLKFKFAMLDDFCKSLNTEEKLKINEFTHKDIFCSSVHKKQLFNLKNFVNVFSTEKFLKFLSEINNFNFDSRKLNFSVNYSLNSNSYAFSQETNNIFINFLNMSFLKTDFLKDYIDKVSNNKWVIADRDFKFSLMLYFLKTIDENNFQNFISDFEKQLILNKTDDVPFTVDLKGRIISP